MRTHTTHTAEPVYLYPWVDIPAFCPLVTAPSAHHTTPHHTTPHHIATYTLFVSSAPYSTRPTPQQEVWCDVGIGHVLGGKGGVGLQWWKGRCIGHCNRGHQRGENARTLTNCKVTEP